MQIDIILNLFLDPLVQLIIIVVIIPLVIVLAFRRGRGPSHPAAVRKIAKMMDEVGKDKAIKVPPVKTRQEIITEKFAREMGAVGLEPSTESGYIPVSYTPLARFLSERGIDNDIASAISAGLKEEATEQAVRDIIDAAAGTPNVDLTPEEVKKAQDLAVEEWNRVRKSGNP